MRCLRRLILFPLMLGALWTAGPALAGGGNYVFAGGTSRQQAQVRSALDASAFDSTLAWSYWPSSYNSMKPASAKDESASMAPAKFRALLATLIGAPNTVPANATAFAPKRPKTK